MPASHRRPLLSRRTLLSRRAATLTCAAVLAGVAGTGAVWAATATTVELRVDGVARSVTLHGDTVADVLRAAGLRAGEHDVLAPGPGAHVRDGGLVALRRGRPLQLVVDGQQRTVWVTADDVAEALDQVGLDASGAALSASRSRPIGLDGLSLDVRLPKDAGVAADGGRTVLRTTAATVGDLLAETGVALRPTDTLDVPVETPVSNGLLVTVTRRDTTQVVEDVAVPYEVVRTEDGSLTRGTERVTAAGRPGAERRTYAVTLVDGVETGRTLLSSTRTAEPVAQQVAVGTRAPAPVSSAPAPTADGLDWAALARCESGGNPRAVGGGGQYFGLYQFSLSTWRGVGGSGNPVDASPAEQTARAQALYARTGRSSWPVCGRYL